MNNDCDGAKSSSKFVRDCDDDKLASAEWSEFTMVFVTTGKWRTDMEVPQDYKDWWYDHITQEVEMRLRVTIQHVDEVFAFLRTGPGAAKGCKVVIASPDLAKSELLNLQQAGKGHALLFWEYAGSNPVQLTTPPASPAVGSLEIACTVSAPAAAGATSIQYTSATTLPTSGISDAWVRVYSGSAAGQILRVSAVTATTISFTGCAVLPVSAYAAYMAVGHPFPSVLPPGTRNPAPTLIQPLAAGDKIVFFIAGKKLQSSGRSFVRIPPAPVTVDEILAWTALWNYQDSVVKPRIAQIETDLMKPDTLALVSSDFIKIPAIYHDHAGTGAVAFFPGMVNFQVVGGHTVVPAPSGPRDPDTGRDVFQVAFETAISGGGGHETFDKTQDWVDVWYPYHLKNGEAHCGSNVRIKPVSTKFDKWWEEWPIK